jgi:inner membrane protein
MASAFTHAIAGLAFGTAFRRPGLPARFWILGAAGATIPDLDGVGFWLGVPYESIFGHRGFTHSLVFAALFATAGLLAFRGERYARIRARVWIYLFLATASHGMLDAMTSGGGGIAFFAPFVNDRYFFPWRPILVSPMSISRFFTARGLAILSSEFRWVWVPAGVFALAMFSVTRPPAVAKRTEIENT